MSARNHKNWLANPPVESISSECYSSQEIFEEEMITYYQVEKPESVIVEEDDDQD